MKKLLCLLLALLMLLTLAACGNVDPNDPNTPDNPTDPPVDPTDPGTDDPDDPDNPDSTGKKTLAELLVYDIPTESRFDLTDSELEAIEALVAPYSYVQYEFLTSAQLTDSAMMFTAAYSLAHAFEPIANSDKYGVKIIDLEAEVRRIFGADAAFTSNYAAQDYTPYALDTATGMLTILPQGFAENESLYVTYCCIKLDENTYDLWVLDLGQEAYEAMLADPLSEPPTWDDVKAQVLTLDKLVYTIQYDSSNEPRLIGFREYAGN